MAQTKKATAKKTTTKKTSTKKADTKKVEKADNTEELIQRAVMAALATQKAEFEKKLEEIKNESKPAQPKRGVGNIRKFIPEDARVRIQLNIDGKFILADKRGSNFFIELNGYGDSATITFKDLKNFHGRNHTFLNRGKLIITDVVSSADITLDDVYADLNLQKLYDNDKVISPDEIELYLSDEVELDEFNEKLAKSVDIIETILEVAITLFKRSEFSDNNKMNKIREIAKMPDLFTA